MKNNSTRSSCSNGNDSIIHPETLFHNIKKLFGDNSSTLHCQPAECAKRGIVTEYCHGKKIYDQHTLNDITKCKGVSKKGTRIFESLHSALNEKNCNSSRCTNNLSNDIQLQGNKNNNYKLKAYRYISDEFCPFCQKVPHKHTMNKDNYEEYVSEDKRRKWKQFHKMPDKKDNEIATCYLRIPKKYLIKNQGFSQKSISLNLDDNEDEYNIVIQNNSVPLGKENLIDVIRNNVTLNCTSKQINDNNSGPSNKMNKWLERNAMSNEQVGNEYHFQQKHKKSDFSYRQHKKDCSDHGNESIAVSYSTVKINYQIAPLLLMASAVSRQILQTAITNYESFVLYGIFKNYQIKRPPQIPVTLDVSVSCKLDNTTTSLTTQQKSLECPKNKLGYSESSNEQFGKVSDSRNINGLCITSTNIRRGENSKMRSEYREYREHSIQQQSIKVHDCDEICQEISNNSLFGRITNINDTFSTLLPKAYKATIQIINVGLTNYENYFRFGVYYKEDLKNNVVQDASVSCNLASEIDSEMMQLNTLLFNIMKQEFVDIFEISRKLKSSASEILGTLNNYTKIPKLAYEDETDNELYSQTTSHESLIPYLSKIESNDKFNTKTILPNTEIKFKRNKFIDKIPNYVPLTHDNLNIVFPSLLDKFHQTQDVHRTVNSKQNEESIKQNKNNDNKHHDESNSEQEQKEQYNGIETILDIQNFDKEAVCSHQLRGELNNRQKNRLRKWEYYCSKPSLQARNCFSEGCISTSRSLPVQGTQPHKILWCLTRVTSYVNGARTYEFIDKMQLATPNSIGDNTAEQETEIPNMVVVMSHYDDSNESLVNHASSSQNL